MMHDPDSPAAGARDAAAEAVCLRERMREDPVFFCRHVLGVRPWQRQREVLRALRDHERVAVRSGHGTGKSFIAAAATLWFLYSYYPAKVITTAPTWNQVRQILWSEIRRLHAASRVPLGGRVLEERIRLGDDAFAIGISTDEAERFQGFHAESVLVILDEAPGVREEIWQAAQTLLTGRTGRLLAIGNPTRPVGSFYEAFSAGSGWKQVRISCLDSPNVRLGRPIFPRLVTRDWVEGRRRDWGEDTALWRSRVLGDFPDDAQSLLVPRLWIEAAFDTNVATESKMREALSAAVEGGRDLRLGVDVAREGADATVFLIRDEERVLWAQEARGWSTMQVAGRVLDLIRRYALRPESVFIDDTGLGAGVTDRLREQDLPVCAVIASARAEHPEHFLNLRAECGWRMREALNPEGEAKLRLPAALAELGRELSALSYEFASSGAIKLADKVTLRGRLSGSPNYADALALTFATVNDGPDIRISIL